MTFRIHKPVLVLGHTGFLGSAVSADLRARNIEFYGASLTTGFDLRDPTAMKSLVTAHEFGSIINCAAHVGGIAYGLKNQKDIFVDNMKMTLSLLTGWEISGAKLVNPISNCAYPGKLNRFSEDQFWDGPVHDSVYAYGETRRSLVSGTHLYMKMQGLKGSNLIFPNIYGPGDHLDAERAHALGGLISRMIEAKEANIASFEVWGTGNPIREWMYIYDASRILVDNALADTDYPLRNFGVGKGISIKDLTHLIANLLEFQGKISFNSSKPDGASEKIMVLDSKYGNNEGTYELFESGLLKTIKWYQDQRKAIDAKHI